MTPKFFHKIVAKCCGYNHWDFRTRIKAAEIFYFIVGGLLAGVVIGLIMEGVS